MPRSIQILNAISTSTVLILASCKSSGNQEIEIPEKAIVIMNLNVPKPYIEIQDDDGTILQRIEVLEDQ